MTWKQWAVGDLKLKQDMLLRVMNYWGNKSSRKVLQSWRVVTQKRRTAVFLLGAVLGGKVLRRHFDTFTGGEQLMRFNKGLQSISSIVGRKMKASGWAQFGRSVVMARCAR